MARLGSFGKYVGTNKAELAHTLAGGHEWEIASRELVLRSPKLMAGSWAKLLTSFLQTNMLATPGSE